MRPAVLIAVTMTLSLAGAGWAHHSFAAEFDGSKAVRIKGFLTKIQWTNPHSYVDVKDDQGML